MSDSGSKPEPAWPSERTDLAAEEDDDPSVETMTVVPSQVPPRLTKPSVRFSTPSMLPPLVAEGRGPSPAKGAKVDRPLAPAVRVDFPAPEFSMPNRPLPFAVPLAPIAQRWRRPGSPTPEAGQERDRAAAPNDAGAAESGFGGAVEVGFGDSAERGAVGAVESGLGGTVEGGAVGAAESGFGGAVESGIAGGGGIAGGHVRAGASLWQHHASVPQGAAIRSSGARPFDAPLSLTPVSLPPASSVANLGENRGATDPHSTRMLGAGGLQLAASILVGVVVGLAVVSIGASSLGREGIAAFTSTLEGRVKRWRGQRPSEEATSPVPGDAPFASSSNNDAQVDVAAEVHASEAPLTVPSVPPVAPPELAVPSVAPPELAVPSVAPLANDSSLATVELGGADVASDKAFVMLPASAKGHRVYVDGRVVPAIGDAAIVVDCGKRNIKIGSSGSDRVMDFPCGRRFSLE